MIRIRIRTTYIILLFTPGCTCLRFTSSQGRARGTFSSPDYPRAYPARVDCLLYTFLAAPHEIVELVFTDFDVYKGHLE
ncbi:hypothetical protein EVAR_95240_1 [Eumeta japonica]|uniref:CUB domain-containing protein n=1 Tax=Eumeta variegata TaxID=151549 RepID=A0A4C1UK78_EUMVA|nr:hypothetical protein EVAR_95240_1 [Eumeta japonica]